MIKFLEERKYLSWIITILIAAEIFYFSSISSVPGGTPAEGFNLAIVYHSIVFFLLSFFLLISIKGKNKMKTKYIIWTIAISLIYAISDEVHQLFVPGRVAGIKDILIDSAGILIATIIYPKKI